MYTFYIVCIRDVKTREIWISCPKVNFLGPIRISTQAVYYMEAGRAELQTGWAGRVYSTFPVSDVVLFISRSAACGCVSCTFSFHCTSTLHLGAYNSSCCKNLKSAWTQTHVQRYVWWNSATLIARPVLPLSCRSHLTLVVICREVRHSGCISVSYTHLTLPTILRV